MHSRETALGLVPILNLARSVFYFCLCAGASATELRAGALEDYVQQPDTNFAWVKIDEKQAEGFTVAHLQVTSQLWRTNLWTHHVQIARPEKVRNPASLSSTSLATAGVPAACPCCRPWPDAPAPSRRWSPASRTSRSMTGGKRTP